MNNEAIEDAVLDEEIAKSIAEVNAGKSLSDKPETQTEEQKPAETIKDDVKKVDASDEGDSHPQPEDPQKVDNDFRIPNKGKFESDEAYEKRVELFDLVKKRKLATTPEAKQALSTEISRTKSELKTLSEADTTLLKTVKTENDKVDDPTLEADRERLKALGGATKEDIMQILREERQQIEAKNTLENFVAKYKDLQDPDVREVFFDFVEQNYNWEGKTGKQLLTVLELARENMFKPSESIQERVLKSANVQEKVNAMQFPGNTGAEVNNLSPEVKSSIEQLKSIGMSEEKAIELLSD